MPPTDIAPAIIVSHARLLGAAILFGVVVLLSVLVAWRRFRAARQAAIDAPLRRLRGFHIFGPDDDDAELPLHVPVIVARPAQPSVTLQGRPAVRNGNRPVPSPARLAAAVAPALPAPPPNGAPAPVRAVVAAAASSLALPAPGARAVASAAHASPTSTPRAAAAAAPARPVPGAEPLVTWTAPAAAAAVAEAPPPPRRSARRPATARSATPSPDAGGDKAGEVVLEGTAAPSPTRAARTLPRPTRPAPEPGDASAHILLVEDDPTIAGMYAMLLGTKGYRTRHAQDGVEGIAMVREELPSLILLDMMMPRMDGLQFLKALRDWPKTQDLPVVVLSNVGDRPMVEKAMALGAIEYLVKAQTRPQVLLGALPHWLRGNRALTTLS
jgi:CheY-like chemotaxis protein